MARSRSGSRERDRRRDRDRNDRHGRDRDRSDRRDRDRDRHERDRRHRSRSRRRSRERYREREERHSRDRYSRDDRRTRSRSRSATRSASTATQPTGSTSHVDPLKGATDTRPTQPSSFSSPNVKDVAHDVAHDVALVKNSAGKADGNAATENASLKAKTEEQKAAEEKIRLRKEKLEAWKRKKEEEERIRREQEQERLKKEEEERLKKEELEAGEISVTTEVENTHGDIPIGDIEKSSENAATMSGKPSQTDKTGHTAPIAIKKSVKSFGFSLGLGAKKTTTSSRSQTSLSSSNGLQNTKKKPISLVVEDEETLPPLKKLKFELGATETTAATENGDTKEDSNSDKGEDVEMTDANVNANEADELDAFMQDVHAEVTKLVHATKPDNAESSQTAPTTSGKQADEEDEELDLDFAADEEEDILALAAKKLSKKKDLIAVDHSQINYLPFRKDFFVESALLSSLTPEEVDLLRAELDGIKIRGKDCPKPAAKWSYLGLPPSVFDVITRVLKYEKPSPIQAQAIPAIMSGRDVIGIAKTGSGKTIAFLLPMLRHIKAQPPLGMNDGPIALIMTPTRELATQIFRETKVFAKALGLNAVCAYGGSPIKDQISELKRGAEIVICTPGRMIDLLCANSGRVTNLHRVTYLVLDEADRMFDMGFEPQVMKIVQNVRPDRQTVLFSATFPRQMEALARKVLQRPLEITVGGRSVVCADVSQKVQVIPEDAKFVRLLEILGEWQNGEEDSRALIFVEKQESADNLLRDLLRRGYPCQSLHGGKEQLDRDYTITSFKNGDINMLIATSVAARGLDVKSLNLVVNYDCPNHMEDYVHRCGRTGRAGRKGTAYTFITPEQEKYALDISKALKMSGTEIPKDVQELADKFLSKVKCGNASFHSSGFGGKGLEKLDQERDKVKKLEKKAYGKDLGDEEEEEETETAGAGGEKGGAPGVSSGVGTSAEPDRPLPYKFEAIPVGYEQLKEMAPASTTQAQPAAPTPTPTAPADPLKAAQEAAAKIAASTADDKESLLLKAQQRAQSVASALSAAQQAAALVTPRQPPASQPAYGYEIEINEFPQKARWKVTNKETMVMIGEHTSASITIKGIYCPPGSKPPEGERKLFLLVEGESQMVIDQAKNEIKRILMDTTLQVMEREAETQSGRYSVV